MALRYCPTFSGGPSLSQSLGVPLDHREGGAQVVGDVGNEGLLLLVHPLFLPPGLVQLIQQTAELTP